MTTPSTSRGRWPRPRFCCRLAEVVGHPGSHVKFYVAQAMLSLDVSYWIHSSRHLHITWVCCIRPALLPVKNIAVECTRSRCWTAGNPRQPCGAAGACRTAGRTRGRRLETGGRLRRSFTATKSSKPCESCNSRATKTSTFARSQPRRSGASQFAAPTRGIKRGSDEGVPVLCAPALDSDGAESSTREALADVQRIGGDGAED
jgi:hypothetical protein